MDIPKTVSDGGPLKAKKLRKVIPSWLPSQQAVRLGAEGGVRTRTDRSPADFKSAASASSATSAPTYKGENCVRLKTRGVRTPLPAVVDWRRRADLNR